MRKRCLLVVVLVSLALNSVVVKAHDLPESIFGRYEGEVRGTAIAMLIEGASSPNTVLMRQRLDNSVEPKFELVTGAMVGQIASDATLNTLFADKNFARQVTCIHPLNEPPAYIPLICRVPKDTEFRFAGAYGTYSPFKSVTGAIYVYPFVDHLVAIDLVFLPQKP